MREEYKHLAPLMRKEEYMAAILAELCKLNDNIEKLVQSNEPKTQPTPQAKKKTEKTKTEQKEAVAKKSTTTRKSTPKKKDEV